MVGFVRDRDIYGQAVTLNYKGDDTFKTFPGGILSLFVTLAVLSYAALKTKYLTDRENWSLT